MPQKFKLRPSRLYELFPEQSVVNTEEYDAITVAYQGTRELLLPDGRSLLGLDVIGPTTVAAGDVEARLQNITFFPAKRDIDETLLEVLIGKENQLSAGDLNLNAQAERSNKVLQALQNYPITVSLLAEEKMIIERYNELILIEEPTPEEQALIAEIIERVNDIRAYLEINEDFPPVV